MENSSVYMCFPCYQEFNTLEEVLKHQLTCTTLKRTGHFSVQPVTTTLKQTAVSAKLPSDQPRILYQCGDCDELFKSLDLWQQHRKEGTCQQSGSKSKPDSQAEPESSSAQSPTLPLNPDESSFASPGTSTNVKPEPVDEPVEEEEEQEAAETLPSQRSDPIVSEVTASTSNPEDSSPRRRGANKKPKPEPVLLCVDCGSCFGLVSELVTHRKTQHGFEEALHRCSVCGESFLNTTLFLYHRKQHRQKGEEKVMVAPEVTSEEVCTRSNGTQEQEMDATPSITVVTFTQPELFMCTQCGQSFSDEEGLVIHRKQKHDLKEPLHTCSHCGVSFMNTTLYMYHWQQHRNKSVGAKDEVEGSTAADSDNTNHPPPAKLLHDWARTPLPHVCPYCGKTFTRRVFLRTHVYSHTGEKLFTCKVCTKSFTNSQSLLRHSMSHTGSKPYSCNVCCKNFSQAATLKRHQRIHTSTLPRRKRGRKPGAAHLFSCPNCPSRFSTEDQLNHHKLLHTSHPFPCPECGEAFKRRRDLDLHSLTHQDKQPATCAHCSAQFVNQAVLEIHQQRCPTTEEERNTGRGRGQGRGRCTGQIECDLCGHRCMTQEGLDLHRLSHTGQTPLKCPVRPCRRRFTSNSALEEHVLAHFQGTLSKSKNRPRFRCQICHKDFAYNSTFSVHMRTHTDERPFECATCGKRFRQLPHLQDHERIHSGLRPFCCWICGKSFSVAARLTEHARTHSGEKPYPCHHCPAAFRSRSNLDKHIRLHTDVTSEAEEVVHVAEAAQVQRMLEEAKVQTTLATTGEVDSGSVQTIYVLQGGEGGTETGAEGTQVVILPSSVLGTQGIAVPTITMDGNEITMVETSQSPQHAIEFIVEETI
uniref:Zinc finger protein 574 n=1 Tax=Acanthochromis polyacanthus TaxID=80966 RepID=A0A3Q1EMY9_9TELE